MDELTRARFWVLAVFAGALAVGSLYLDIRGEQRVAEARRLAFDTAVAQANSLRREFARAISSVHTLASVVRLNGGIPDFPAFAEELVAAYGSVTVLQLAPGGIVRAIYPPAGHEAALGLDLFDPATPGHEEALRAYRERRLVVAGPLRLVQGNVGLIARQPVFGAGDQPGDVFWGMVTVLIGVDDLLASTPLDLLAESGYRYRLIARGPASPDLLAGEPIDDAEHPVRIHFGIHDGGWELALVPVGGWLNRGAMALDGLVALVASLLLSALVWSQLRRPSTLAAQVRRATTHLEERHRELRRQLHEVDQAGSALRKSEAQQDAMLDRATVALLVHDARGRLLQANAEACRLLGYRREALLALSVTDIEVNYARDELDTIWRGLAPGDRQTLRGRWRTAHGGEFPVELRLSCYRDPVSGQPVYIAVVRDMAQREAARAELERANADLESAVGERTAELVELNRQLTQETRDRRRVQRALYRATREAEEANDAKSRFLAMISHEIRTPMNALLGMLGLLRVGSLSPRQHEYAAIANASGLLLMELLGELVDVSRIERGGGQARAAPVPLRPLFEQLAGLHRWRAQEKGIDFRLELDPALPDGVLIDPLRLRQVVHNLLGNAIKFTERGHVALQVSRDETGRLAVVVADTGVGIEPEAQKRIFESFSQADPTIARRYGGTGLGLSICRQLVAALGGTLTLTSRPGEGSVFTVRLPAEACPGGDAEKPLIPAAAFPGCRVLVVEDNEVNRRVVVGMLRRLGCEPHCAGTGREALELIGREPFDLVLMDCQMPVLDGLDATRQLRRRERPGAHLPVVALTAHVLPEDRERCREAGMDDHLPKPITFESLHAVLACWLPSGFSEVSHDPA